MSLVIQLCSNNSNINLIFDGEENKTNNSSEDEDENNSDDAISNYFLILEKNLKIKKEQEKLTLKSIKKILSDYNNNFLCSWIDTYNFKLWLNEKDPNLFQRSIYIKQQIL